LSQLLPKDVPELPLSPWNSPTFGPQPTEKELPLSTPGSPYEFRVNIVELPPLPVSPVAFLERKMSLPKFVEVEEDQTEQILPTELVTEASERDDIEIAESVIVDTVPPPPPLSEVSSAAPSGNLSKQRQRAARKVATDVEKVVTEESFKDFVTSREVVEEETKEIGKPLSDVYFESGAIIEMEDKGKEKGEEAEIVKEEAEESVAPVVIVEETQKGYES
jgi:hypothetical protein